MKEENGWMDGCGESFQKNGNRKGFFLFCPGGRVCVVVLCGMSAGIVRSTVRGGVNGKKRRKSILLCLWVKLEMGNKTRSKQKRHDKVALREVRVWVWWKKQTASEGPTSSWYQALPRRHHNFPSENVFLFYKAPPADQQTPKVHSLLALYFLCSLLLRPPFNFTLFILEITNLSFWLVTRFPWCPVI